VFLESGEDSVAEPHDIVDDEIASLDLQDLPIRVANPAQLLTQIHHVQQLMLLVVQLIGHLQQQLRPDPASRVHA
jgi:hypothetical protein